MKEKDVVLSEIIQCNKNYFSILLKNKVSYELKHEVISKNPELISYLSDEEIDVELEKCVFFNTSDLICLKFINHPSIEFLFFLIANSRKKVVEFITFQLNDENKKEYLFKLLYKNEKFYRKFIKALNINRKKDFEIFSSKFIKYNNLDEKIYKASILIDFVRKNDGKYFSLGLYEPLLELDEKFFSRDILYALIRLGEYYKDREELNCGKKIKKIIENKDNDITLEQVKEIHYESFLHYMNNDELFDYLYNDFLNENFYDNFKVFLKKVPSLDFTLSDRFSLEQIELLLDRFLKIYGGTKNFESFVMHNLRYSGLYSISFFSYDKRKEFATKDFLEKYFDISFIENNFFIKSFKGETKESYNSHEFYNVYKILGAKRIYDYLTILNEGNKSFYFMKNFFKENYLDENNNKEEVLESYFNFLNKEENVSFNETFLLKDIIDCFLKLDFKNFYEIKLTDNFINLLSKIFLNSFPGYFYNNLFALLINNMDFNDLDKYSLDLCKFVLKVQKNLRINISEKGKTKNNYKKALLENNIH